MSGEESQHTEISSVKDLVEEHFSRALSSTVRENPKDTQEDTARAKQTRNTLKEYLKSPPTTRENGIKRKQEQMSPTANKITSPFPIHTITTLNQTTASQSKLSSQFPGTTPQPTSHPVSSMSTRGVIVYPEFINFLIHPRVDVFRDIPRLPGQGDGNSLPGQPREGWGENDDMDTNQYGSAHASHTIHTPTSHTTHTHTLHHGQPTSPWSSNITSPQTEMNPFILSPSTSCQSPGPDLTRDELKAILELSDNVI